MNTAHQGDGSGWVHTRIWLHHNRLKETLETRLGGDKTLRTAIAKVLPAIRLFANWVQEFEDPNRREGRVRGNNLTAIYEEYDRALAGEQQIGGLLQSLQRALAGHSSCNATDVMRQADDLRAALETQLHILRRPKKEPRCIDLLDVVHFKSWPRITLTKRARQRPPEKWRHRGRPAQERDIGSTVLEAIRAEPGIGVRALCRRTRLRMKDVTAAYKALVQDGSVRTEPGARNQIRLFPKINPHK